NDIPFGGLCVPRGVMTNIRASPEAGCSNSNLDQSETSSKVIGTRADPLMTPSTFTCSMTSNREILFVSESTDADLLKTVQAWCITQHVPTEGQRRYCAS